MGFVMEINIEVGKMLKFKFEAPADPYVMFSPDAKIECVGEKVTRDGREVATIIGYEIVDGRLILECETDDKETMQAIAHKIINDES